MVKEWICQEEPLIRADGASVGVGFRQMVELIRCKDCDYVCMCKSTEMFPDMPVYAKCTLTDEVHEPDWFCADGECSQAADKKDSC